MVFCALFCGIRQCSLRILCGFGVWFSLAVLLVLRNLGLFDECFLSVC